MYAQLLLLMAVGIPIAITDQRSKRIPNGLVLLLFGASELMRLIFDRSHFWLSQEVGGASAFTCGVLYLIFRRKIGMGDLKLMVVLGFLLADFHRVVFGTFLALLLAGVMSLFSRKRSVAFAPALIAAALLTL